ncbi:UNVERIFIED_CONTAM: hypothetical protein LK11_13740 [Mumia flava]
MVDFAGVDKHFGRTHALDGLDLRVEPGSVHGFLGPNGAGKSTTIRILLGLVRADGGRPLLFGRDPWRHAVELHERLAYVPGDVVLWPSLSAGECIDLLATSGPRINADRRSELTERFDLDPTKRARDLSKGTRQKVALVAALASDVDLLVLDEPTSGLDPLMEEVFQECVRERAQAGTTVLLSSHILGEVDALADTVTIIRQGRTVESSALADLRRRTRTKVRATTSGDVAGLDSVAALADLASTRVDGQVESSFTVPPDHLPEALVALQDAGLLTLTATPPSLDELFASAYESGAAS